jgi:hypothetical protein
MQDFTITDYTNQEIDFLSEMIQEKLIDMGYDSDGSFSFDLIVSFEDKKSGGTIR